MRECYRVTLLMTIPVITRVMVVTRREGVVVRVWW